jgi:hypothetical protein
MQNIINIKKLPNELQQIANAAIDSNSAHDELNLEPLFHWLVWESENDGGEEIFIKLSYLDLSDYALLEKLDDKTSIIDDNMRIVFARNALQVKIDKQDHDCVFACSWRIERDDGNGVFACCNMIMAGQGGPEIDRFCLHPTIVAFWDELKRCGFHHVGDPIENIDVEIIFRNWSRGLPPRLVFSRTEKNAK